jgi:hypothetical protein
MPKPALLRTLASLVGGVALLAFVAAARGDASAPEIKARALPHPSLISLYESWFEHPYDYMFDGSAPLIKAGGHELGMLKAGIGGIIRYGALNEAAARLLKVPLANFGDVQPIGKLAGLPVFLKEDTQGTGYSHYNPALVRWGHENLIPNPDDRVAGQPCKVLYQGIFRRFFRLMAESYVYLDRGKRWDKETRAYEKAMSRGKDFDGIRYLEGRFAGALPAYAVGQDGTSFTPEMAIGFWLRRKMDGSAAETWTGLGKVMALYDEPYFRKLQQP